MQSFRERCGYHSNQQNFQPPSQDSSRLENYRHQSQPGLNCERQRMVTKEYYAQPSFQGYENSAVDKYHRGTKPLPGQQLQVRPAFPTYGAVQENSAYPAQFSGEEALQNWGPSQQALAGGVAKYEETLMKKTAVPADSRQYQEQAAQLPFQAHPLHLPQQQQTTVTYNKLQRQKIQNDVASFPQTAHFTPHPQSFPPSSTYSTVQGHAVHTYKSCSAPSNQHQERPVASANMASAQRVQSLHGYQPNRIAYDQQSTLQSRHHGQETLHYQNIAKYQHYNQQNQTYCQSDSQVRTPEQYYQAFSPGSSHSPARSVGRSPSYSSTPSPLMPTIENFQYNQQPLNAANFPAAMPDHSHFMPLLNPSPTDTSSPDHQPVKCKNLQKDKLAENILSDLSLQSLSALTSQVENITAVQKLLSKSVIPQKKSGKNPHRTSEQVKGQHCSPENNAYPMDQIGTPVSDRLSTPQSAHNEAQDTDYMSGSEDPLERGYLFCDQSRSPARANHKTKPESLSTCSVTSPDNMSVKSDDSFQSINATLPLGSFAKYVTSDGDCPQLLGNALSQDELSSEIIALQDAINSEKTDKDWEMKLLTCNVRSPGMGIGEMVKGVESCMKNSTKENVESNASKDLGKPPFQLENNRACLEPAAKRTWSGPQNHNALCEPLKLKKSPDGSNCTDFSKETFQDTRADYSTSETKKAHHVAGTLAYNSKNTLPTSINSSSYSCYSNSNPTSAKNAEAFGWLDKSINESCLRWKELEMSLNLSDPEKDLFQGKLISLNKEQKRTSQNELSCRNESNEKLQKAVEMTEEEEEAIRYPDANKAENERWLEDARNCCADSEFQDISLIGSPEVKVSDLEQGEYSPLCDISSPERKSVMDDTSLSRCREKAPVASEDTLESPAEDMTTDVKENSVSAPQLTSQSVMLLGPVIGTESKVQSWFGSSLPHIEDEEENNSGDGTDKETEKLQPEKILPEDLNSQIVPESNMKVNMADSNENKSHHRNNTNCNVSEVGESKETMPDLSKNVQVFVTVPDHSTIFSDQPESEKEYTNAHVPMKGVNQIRNIPAPTSVNHIVDIQAQIKNVAQTKQIQAPTELVTNSAKIQDQLKHVDQTVHIYASTEKGVHTGTIQDPDQSISRHIPGASKIVDHTGHTQAPPESAKQLVHTQTPKKSMADTIHSQVLTENVDQAGHVQAPTKSVDQRTSIPSAVKSVTQRMHALASIESFDQTIHIQSPVESLDRARHIHSPMKSVIQHVHIQGTIGNVTQATGIQPPVKSMHQLADILSPTEYVHQSAPDQTFSESVKDNIPILAPTESLCPVVEIQTALESGCSIAPIQAQMDSMDKKICNQVPTENSSHVRHSKTPVESVHQTTYTRAPAKTVAEAIDIQPIVEQVHEIGHTQVQVNLVHQTVDVHSLHQTMCIQAPRKTVYKTEDMSVRSVSETNDLLFPIESADETTNNKTKIKCVHPTTNDTQVPMKSVGQHNKLQSAFSNVCQTVGIEVVMVKSIAKATDIKGPVKGVDETNTLQDSMQNVDHTNDRQHSVEIVHQAKHTQAAYEFVNEKVNEADNPQSPIENVDHIDDLQIQMQSIAQAEAPQAPMKIVQTEHLREAQVKSINKSAATEIVQQTTTFQLPMENADQNSVPAFTATGMPVRMCTRSSTASAEPLATGPRQGKLTKRVARGMKLRTALKAELQNETLIPLVVQTSHDDLSASLSQESDSGNQRAKNTDDQLLTARNQRSMILRSRNKTQELFHMKRRHEKRATEVRLKNCKVTKRMGPSSRITPPAFKLACRGAQKIQASAKGPKLAKASITGKGPGRPPLNTLKRKSSLISPIPAKKRNLILRRNSNAKEQKQVGRPRLFRKRLLVKTENPKLQANGPCKTGLRKPAGRPPSAGLKLSPRAASQGELKTKVLPPRKGRGLKLGAIVQHISPPQSKKPGGATAASSSQADDDLGGAPPDRALRNAGVCAEAGSRSLGCQAAADQLCRNTNRRLKGKLPRLGKRPSAESSGDDEACSSPEAPDGSSMGIHRMVEAQSPGARTRKCRPAAGPGLATESEACLTPAAALRQRPRDKMERRREPSSDDEQDEDSAGEEDEEEEPTPEAKRPLGRPRKRPNHATFNGYSKRQRIGLSTSKAKKKAKSRKSRAKRRQAPIVTPTEPEIRLKYLSCKPIQRVESRAKLFAPYVQVVTKDSLSTVCTVINSPADELALQQVQCPSLSGTTSARDHKRPTLPSSSAMKLGPLVSKAVPVTCLMCCICRNPSNHRDLGDLCGPYYPEDCLPKKKSRLKEKMLKLEGLSELPLLPPDRTHRATEGGCSASVAAIDKHAELDCAAKQTLRSSTRGLYRKLQSCYCCDGRAEGEEAEKSRRHQCSKSSLVSLSHESASETQEHWVHEACVIWTRGVYLVGGKLYGLQDAADMAAKVVCPVCQQSGASVSCCHKGCAQTYHFTCANETGCLLNEDNFSLRCLKHKRHFL